MRPFRNRKPVFWLTIAAGVAVVAVSAIITVRMMGPADASPLRLEADISERKLYVHHGGEVISTYDIAVGQPGHPTPRGSYSIGRVIWNPAWIPPDREWAEGEPRGEPGSSSNPMQVVKLMFNPPYYYIHGTNAPGSLGTAASHGCIRVSPAAARALGKTVMAHGGAGRGGGWVDEVLQGSQRRPVNLPNPVPLTIHD